MAGTEIGRDAIIARCLKRDIAALRSTVPDLSVACTCGDSRSPRGADRQASCHLSVALGMFGAGTRIPLGGGGRGRQLRPTCKGSKRLVSLPRANARSEVTSRWRHRGPFEGQMKQAALGISVPSHRPMEVKSTQAWGAASGLFRASRGAPTVEQVSQHLLAHGQAPRHVEAACEESGCRGWEGPGSQVPQTPAVSPRSFRAHL